VKAARLANAPFAGTRVVVADVETSGLDPHTDRLIAIGAVALEHGLIRLGDSFRVVLRQAHASAADNILVHGIDGTTQLGGVEPGEALTAWLRFAGDAPLAGFHADFDRIAIARAAKAALGAEPANAWLDLAFIAPALFRREAASLDEWLRHFGIEAYARHDALADALATAQLLQIVLAEADRSGIRTLRELRALERDQRWLERSLRR
jgi:DNA polymerase III subunit epsilon